MYVCLELVALLLVEVQGGHGLGYPLKGLHGACTNHIPHIRWIKLQQRLEGTTQYGPIHLPTFFGVQIGHLIVVEIDDILDRTFDFIDYTGNAIGGLGHLLHPFHLRFIIGNPSQGLDRTHNQGADRGGDSGGILGYIVCDVYILGHNFLPVGWGIRVGIPLPFNGHTTSGHGFHNIHNTRQTLNGFHGHPKFFHISPGNITQLLGHFIVSKYIDDGR